MRIRTIKPEFWSHRMHEAISETAALLAIGLLNIADDDGRFMANPRYVECEVFKTRRPKKRIAACLAELESVGYLRRYKAVMDGREVDLGVIPNFRKHQVISKPYPSRLAPPPFQECSGNDTVTLQSDSVPVPVMERKGKERNRKGIGKETNTHPLTPSQEGEETENDHGACMTDKPNGNGQHNPCIQEPEDAPDKKAGDVPPDDDAHCNPPVAEPDKKKPNTQLLALEAMRCYEGNPTQPARSVVTHIQELLNSGYTVEQMRLVFGAIMRGQIEWPPRTAFAMTEPGRFGGLLTLAMQAQNGAGAPLTPQEKAERAAWKRRVEKERAERKQEQAELAKRTPEEKEWRKSIKLCPKI